MYFLIAENMTVEQRDELDAGLAEPRDLRRGRVALAQRAAQRAGGEVRS